MASLILSSNQSNRHPDVGSFLHVRVEPIDTGSFVELGLRLHAPAKFWYVEVHPYIFSINKCNHRFVARTTLVCTCRSSLPKFIKAQIRLVLTHGCGIANSRHNKCIERKLVIIREF